MQQKITINEIDHDDKSVSAKHANRVLPYGLDKLNENIAKTIAKKFIHETRYDPVHSTEDEQRFFKALPLWLTCLQHADAIECSLESDSHSYKVDLTKNDIADANQLAFNEIALSLRALLPNDNKNILIICSPNSEKIFYLTDFLKTLPGCAVEILEKTSLSKQALLLKDTVLSKQEQVLYTTSLNWHENTTDTEIVFNSKSLRHIDKIPTHILYNNIAYSLADETFINKIDDAMDVSVCGVKSEDVICKITNNGYLKELIKPNATTISINNVEINKKYFISIGDTLTIENNESEFYFIKVNKYET